MKISDIDKNLKISDGVAPESAVWFDAKAEPFKLFGIFYEEETSQYTRMPKKVYDTVSQGVALLAPYTAGGRLKFKTNSPFIGIKAVMKNVEMMGHMTLACESGFDLYAKGADGYDCYCHTFMPPIGMKEGYSSIYKADKMVNDCHINYTEEVLEYTINFPLYDGVQELYIALDKDAVLLEADDYRDIKPMVFYGSSITQGGCTSRPGNAYPAMITRMFNIDHINLGFSGNCKGESTMADYLASLDMSVFICDYDHNAPTAEHLKVTLADIYAKVRKNYPTLPYIFVSATDAKLFPAAFNHRKEVIFEAYQNALALGDKNVYFIDGSKLFDGDGWDSCTVDGCHPNDLGFFRMAQGISKVIKEALKL